MHHTGPLPLTEHSPLYQTKLSKHFLFVSATSDASGKFKWEERKKKKPTTPVQNTEGSSLVEEDKIAGLRAARLLLRERIF